MRRIRLRSADFQRELLYEKLFDFVETVGYDFLVIVPGVLEHFDRIAESLFSFLGHPGHLAEHVDGHFFRLVLQLYNGVEGVVEGGFLKINDLLCVSFHVINSSNFFVD
jgi:hypothetical protein